MRTKEKTYFQTLAELPPKELWDINKNEPCYTDFADVERIKELEVNLIDELKYFRDDLMDKQQQDRITIIEYTIHELLIPYETVRLAMGRLPDPERDEGRATMLLLRRAITGIISMTKYDLKLRFTDDFVKYWERRQINRLLGEVNFSDKVNKPEAKKPEAKKQMDLNRLDNLFNPQQIDNSKIHDFKIDLTNYVTGYNKMQITALALIIFENNLLHKNTMAELKNFKNWQKLFCNILGVEESTYRPSNIKEEEITKMKKNYYYLFT